MPLPPTSLENALGPYKLLRPIGEGGMGTVYLALDPALNRQVAIKILRSQNGSKASAKRFLREAQSAAKLNHPNVVTIHAIDPNPTKLYIVMEYVEGGSLSQHLRKNGPLHWRHATQISRDALKALAAAHHAGIVHRDVKPANLMCSRDPQGQEIIKLADFGLARIATPTDADLTFPGAFVGSPSYSSPEQIAGSAKIDGRADLYSLAATLYALLTGQPPFMADDPAEVMDQHLNSPFPDVRLLAPTCPKQMQILIAKASEKHPQDRYQSAQEMLQAVEQLLQLPADVIAANVKAAAPVNKTPAVPALPNVPPELSHSDESIAELETRLARARQQSDSSTQLSTLRTLYGVYAQMDRQQDALRAFREALVVHVKMHAPMNN